MENPNFDINKYLMANTKSTKDYILLVRNNLKILLLISAVIIALAIIYAIISKDVYKSSLAIKISQQGQDILENQGSGYQSIESSDRFIANEIGIIQNYNTRERIARALIDTFDNSSDKSQFKLLSAKEGKGINGHRSLSEIAGILKSKLTVEQSPGTDVIELSAESGSPYEASLIANAAAEQYKRLNLEINRQHLTNIRTFLEKRAEEKLAELGSSEDTLIRFRERGGIVSLDVQSSGLITQLSQLDAQRDAAKIELMTSSENLKQYKSYLGRQDPNLVKYLEGQTSQAYIEGLQKQIAELQVNRDMAMSMKKSDLDVSAKAREFDARIADLKSKLNEVISALKTNAFTSYPEQIRQVAQRLVEEEINNNALTVKLSQLENIIGRYEQDFRRMPKASIELAQYERKRASIQQLYALVDQKYQEAMINELSQPGNVFIIGKARIPDAPEKPNRMMIILFGLILGPVVAFGYLLIKDYFDNKVKTPIDIEKNDIKYLTWVPNFITNGEEGSAKHELIVINEPDSPASESFRSVRARIRFASADNNNIHTILVTSPAEQEGKTVISMNLAASFAQSDKKTLLIDCDLRRPRIHNVMEVDKKPGLVDYLAGRAKLEDIIRNTKQDKLFYITSGTIPSNPAELLESRAMKNFLAEIKNHFDMVILDSPPIVAVIDAEILSKIADGTILVISADKTEVELMNDAVELIKRDKVAFLGTVLNNFKYRSGYNYYYKYYYSYAGSSNGKKPIIKKIIRKST